MCLQVSKEGSDERLVINTVTRYDPARHRQPADFDEDLAAFGDPYLLGDDNPAGCYMQWLHDGRRAASEIPFSLDADGTSFDLQYGVILGVEFPDGSKCASASQPQHSAK